MGRNSDEIIIILYLGCISFEISLAAELLSQKYQILNATPDRHDLIDSSGLPFKAQLSYKQVNLENSRVILVPGGDPKSLILNKEIDRILVKAEVICCFFFLNQLFL